MLLSNTVKILMVEDSPSDADLTIEALKESKLLIDMSLVTDGVEAIAFLRQEGKYINEVLPDLILLDLNLPKKSGFEVLTEIKNDEKLRVIPVIILTTSDDEKDVNDAYSQYANSYVTKPVDFKQFLEVVELIEDFWLTIVKLPKIG